MSNTNTRDAPPPPAPPTAGETLARAFDAAFAEERAEIKALRQAINPDGSLTELADLIDEADENRQLAESAAHYLLHGGERDTLRAEIKALRSVLKELRIIYHAAGRRPEECHEMSIIDDALMETL